MSRTLHVGVVAAAVFALVVLTTTALYPQAAEASPATQGPLAATAPGIDVRVDANGDGRVDLTGATDEAIEDTATALVLPNLDDDAHRARVILRSVNPTQGGNLIDRRLDACNDGADRKVDGPFDALDLAPVLTLPQPGLSADATGRVSITHGEAQAHVFLRTPGGWRIVTPRTVVTAAELAPGLQLGVEARDIVRDLRKWDGRITVEVSVNSVVGEARDSVTLQVAPMLSSNHTQRATTVWVLSGRSAATVQGRFNHTLRRLVSAAGVRYQELPVEAGDPWVQDFVEPMYASVPGPSGPRAMRLLLRSDQRRYASRVLYKLRGRDVGVIWLGPVKHEGTLDSMGNFETIPPYAYRGRSYSAGRVIMGSRRPQMPETPSARMLRVLRAQGQQDPLLLNTSFLAVGHVDEIVQFLPASTPRGWRLAIADPTDALDLLRQAQAAGQGKQLVMPATPRSEAAKLGIPTVDQALGSGKLSVVKANEAAAGIIRTNLELIEAETGITDAEVVRVPVLFRSLPKREDPRECQVALVPNGLNSLLVAPAQVIAAKQFGVRVAGCDLFAQAVNAAYGSAGIDVKWIDDIDAYHWGDGEVHCGTNTLRDVTGAWWQQTD